MALANTFFDRQIYYYFFQVPKDKEMQGLPKALQEAIGKRNVLQILKLLEIDLKPPDRDNEGNTVLHHMLNSEQLPEKIITKVLEIFLSDGIDPNIENNRGETALHLAVAKRMNDAIDLLIKYNTTINIEGRSCITYYFVQDEQDKFWKISDYDEREIAEVQTATFVDWLIYRGFDFHILNEAEDSAFDLAAERWLLHVVTAVLENTKGFGTDGPYITHRQRTLFYSDLSVGEWTGTSDSENQWRVDYSIRHVTNIVKYLLDVMGSTKDERTALLYLAISSDEPSIVEIVTNDFPDGCDERSFATNMFYHFMWNHCQFSTWPVAMKIMSDLIAKGANLDANESSGVGALHWAVSIRSIQVVKFLKDNGASFLAVDDANCNLLHTLAARRVERYHTHKQIEELMELLVNEGLEVNARNKYGRTPLQTAAVNNNRRAARALIFHGAEVVDIRNDERQFCEQCSKEIGVLKDTFVDGRTSLYRFLHMHNNYIYIYANNENLRSIVCSSALRDQLPEYWDRVLSGFKKAKGRYSLVERAKEVRLELTEINLLDECIERIFLYLNNEDLETIIKSYN